MSEPVRLLALGAVSWIRTQSLYHALAELMTEDAPDTLILVRPREPYVCVGYHQPLSAVLDLAACRAARVLVDPEQYPLSVLIASQRGMYGNNWPELMSIAVAAGLPILVICLVSYRRLREGLALGSAR